MNRLLTLGLLALTLTSCGTLRKGPDEVRDRALEPAMIMAWGIDTETGIRSDVVRGLADAVEDGDLADSAVLSAFVGQMDAALEAGGDREALRVIPWSQLRPYGDRGIQRLIDDEEIDALVAPSLTGRLDDFDDAIERLLADPLVIDLRPQAHEARKTFLPDGSMVSGSTLVTAAGESHTVAPTTTRTSTW